MFGRTDIIMKFEDFLLQKPCDHPKQQKRLELQQEVGKLQDELDAELKLSNLLTCALQKDPPPVLPCSCLVHKFIPSKVQMLLRELSIVEKDIVSLERQVDKLKLELNQERKNQPSSLTRHRRHRQHYSYKSSSRGRRASVDSSIDDVQSLPGLIYETPQQSNGIEPNKISQELVNCLISIFLHLNQGSTATMSNNRGSSIIPKHSISCMSSKGLISKASLINSCKAPVLSFDNNNLNIIVDPYGVLPDFNGVIRDIGEYKHFIQITRNSMDRSRVPDCFQAMGRLRALMHKLSNVDLTLLTYKQKLAFWINLYNACIMHAFLEHGLPSTHEKLLALMNKAAVNVGGIILNALAIEHFILRCPSDTTNGIADEKEVLLRHAYGLGYPEPNVTFALCRGSWSSPALRVYTADDVVDQLGRARVEYLEAAVGVTSKKKVLVPKLLQWHMKDFADDMESLLEWIYSQLPPHSGSLKKLMMECVIGETKSPLSRMVEIQPYDSEFRYLLQS
ncbi:uncharacterized protein LOC124932338 [Impatiens glandulifera]|uniref:uncharacterized protein LOC124932338 n=1 Tax=Impatiens glandulifera TaxID=253017 RepID=UPI001FB15C85|nr:uncharacterized protein LOC124932338 [Impatiens glandulifera]